MASFVASHRNARISARARCDLVADLVRGQYADEALDSTQVSSRSVVLGCWRSVIRSAVANALGPGSNRRQPAPNRRVGSDGRSYRWRIDVPPHASPRPRKCSRYQETKQSHQRESHADRRDLKPHESTMGQKVNPIAFRTGVTRGWSSRWYASKKVFADLLVEDRKLRNFITNHPKKTQYKNAGIDRIEIERTRDEVRVMIYVARPGLIIGKKGQEIEILQAELQNLIGRRINLEGRRGWTPGTASSVGRRRHRSATSKAFEFPPHDEAVAGTNDGRRREGHQDSTRRTTWRCRNGSPRETKHGLNSVEHPAGKD